MLPPADSASIADAATNPNIVTGASVLLGWSLRETTGAAGATGIIYDGSATTGQIVAPINLAPSETTRDWFGPHGLRIDVGLYFDPTAGTIDGAVWYVPGEVWDAYFIAQGWRPIWSGGE
jgi:hypothetical protein